MYLSLHTADPKEHGLEATEVNYAGYNRVCADGVPFAFSGIHFTNQEDIAFPRCGRWKCKTITHYAWVETESGPGAIFASTTLDTPFEIEESMAPVFTAGAIDLWAKFPKGPEYVSSN